jgi:hypothetical protein
MTDLSGPPFRADHLGSLLLSAELLLARVHHRARQIAAEEFGVAEDSARTRSAMQCRLGPAPKFGPPVLRVQLLFSSMSSYSGNGSR